MLKVQFPLRHRLRRNHMTSDMPLKSIGNTKFDIVGLQAIQVMRLRHDDLRARQEAKSDHWIWRGSEETIVHWAQDFPRGWEDEQTLQEQNEADATEAGDRIDDQQQQMRPCSPFGAPDELHGASGKGDA